MSELDDQVQQGGSYGGVVQGVPGEGAADLRGGGQDAGDDGAGVGAAGPVGGEPTRAALEQALRGGGRDRGEQADAVDAVIAQGLCLAKPMPCRASTGSGASQSVTCSGSNAAGAGDLAGGGRRDGDGRADADAPVDTQAGERAHPQHLATRDEHVGLLVGGGVIFRVPGGAVTMSGLLAVFGPLPCAVRPRLAPGRGLVARVAVSRRPA
ncbi:hypothetical protein [Streptomyces sp. NPDC047009]|uniref:hypothetical protein n=1 Tax=Streptomyces sp. NPDC047009 TaxID=3154496 RepID=UPI003403F929